MKLMWAALVVAAAGCATPFQRNGVRGGYDEEELGPGHYLVTFRGNGYTSRSTVKTFLHRRAKQLCPEGYAVEDSDASSRTSQTIYQKNGLGGVTATNVQRSEASVVIRCDADRERGRADPSPTAELTPARRELAQQLMSGTPAGRQAYADGMDRAMRNISPPMRVGIKDGADATLVFTSTTCGIGEGFLPRITAHEEVRTSIRTAGFTLVECRGGASLEQWSPDLE